MRRYTGAKDAPAAGLTPGARSLTRLAAAQFGVTSAGGFNVRPILSGPSKGKPSVHGTGRAVDLKYARRPQGVALWDFLLANTALLQIEAVHDYAFPQYGRGYRCSRGEGQRGVKIFTATDNAGSIGGRWIHVEISPFMAQNPPELRKAWRTALERAGLR